MILALDIGNTNIEIGVLPKDKDNFEIVESFRFFTKIEITADELGIFILNYLNIKKIDYTKISEMIFSSVVPPINRTVKEMFKSFFGDKRIIQVGENTILSIKNRYKNPKEVGSDRIVNAEAVFYTYKKNAIIVDMGTATTV
nr:type III pantothenate kinase [Spirochaetota bacterium]